MRLGVDGILITMFVMGAKPTSLTAPLYFK